ncbi:MAG: 3-phosphoserine/phosphohydroxythreonine transaminase [Spirochaetaceae bacterium]|nr:MAG: 3-phosphoserine/phosphohydroxythreonine transaminase [Spirochaetaceae bacterium]
MARVFNFSAGPATLPLEVLQEAQRNLVDYENCGLSLVEMSHRGKEYDKVHTRAGELVREVMGVPPGYAVLFLGGGATLQFGMVPMNLMEEGGMADYTLSGSWAKKAISDARKIGTVNTVYDGTDTAFTTLPDPDSVKSTAGSAYLHITTNETIEGVQWKQFPRTEAPLVADMSSDIMSRPVPVEHFGLIYAGAQKNLGPAGVTVVIVREDLLERIPGTLPAYLSYGTHAKSDSLYNTPPVFPIYMVKLVLEWILREGGLSAIADHNTRKAAMLYDAIEGSDGFYRCPVDPRFRSEMNVVFRLPSEEMEKQFIQQAAAANMSGLKGHRSVGGVRASIYNAMPQEGVAALVDFMRAFADAQS